TISHLVSVLVLKRSILTEKVARRGFHVMREYAVDPLEATFVREVMDTDVYTVEPGLSLAELHGALPEGSPERRQRLYPVLDSKGRVVGVLPWSRVLAGRSDGSTVRAQMVGSFTVAHPDEILRTVADRMAALGLGAVPVVDRADPTRLEGLVTQFDLLEARQKLLEEERRAERVLTLRRVRSGPLGGVPSTTRSPAQDGTCPDPAEATDGAGDTGS
ncbi:MAG TPA: CBS domain-containing protein, partial [Acidimicrobiales bacterium]|nr:CBS domain-containing protein [Acidimicrobiales bacterium]